jgi:hypothetical protein
MGYVIRNPGGVVNLDVLSNRILFEKVYSSSNYYATFCSSPFFNSKIELIYKVL